MIAKTRNPLLRRVVRHLQIGEFLGPVEPNLCSVRESPRLSRSKVHTILFDQPSLVDHLRIQREDRLRNAGIQTRIALVDVDRDRRITRIGKRRSQKRPTEGRGRREESLDGNLILPALVRIRGTNRRVDRNATPHC